MSHYYKFFCSRENLRGIRDFVTSVLKNHPLSETEINQMVLAVDEICSNMIIHSHQCNEEDFIELSIRNQKDGIVFEIVDKGDELFNLSSHQDPSITDIVKQGKKGGVGLMLVKKIMDNVEVLSEDSHHVWRLYKKLPPQRI
ncbi:MAG: ATP-binding protein [Bacteroidota bacterium]